MQSKEELIEENKGTSKLKKLNHRVSAFQRTLIKSEQWIADIREELNWISGDQAYHLLRAVLHALRDQLGVNEAAHLSAQLPLLLRGTYYECWNPVSDNQIRGLNKEEFIDSVRKNMDPVNRPNYDLELAIKVTLKVLMEHVSHGEMTDVINASKPSLRDFFATIDNLNYGERFQ